MHSPTASRPPFRPDEWLPQDESRRPRSGYRLLRQVMPTSRPISVAVLVACGLEASLIAFGKPSLYATDAATIGFGFVFLVWFWISVGWMLDLWGRIGHQFPASRSSRAARVTFWGLTGLLGGSLTLAYSISWVLFFETGRFANLETGRFVLFNFQQLWPYLTQAEPSQLFAAVIVAMSGMVLLPLALARCTDGSCDRQPPSVHWSPILWSLLAVSTLVAWNRLPAEPSMARQSVRQHALRHGLHPAFSLYASRRDALERGGIRAEIDVRRLTPRGNLRLAPSPGDEATATRAVSKSSQVDVSPSVIFIAVESLRADVLHRVHQGQEITPHINRLAAQGHEWTRAYAQSTHSDYSDPSLLSSLYPLRTRHHHYYGPSDPWPRTLIYDVLQPLGYRTAILSSQNEDWSGMTHFLKTPGLETLYHADDNPERTLVADKDTGFAREVRLGGLVAGKFPDAHTTDKAIEWVRAQAREGRPFFLGMNLQSSHFPYLMPDDVPRPFQPAEMSPSMSFVGYPVEDVENARNAYYNAIQECDRQVGRLVDTLRELGLLENTILVVTGENGEAFHEGGQVTHAREPVEPVIHVACVLHAPAMLAPTRDDYPFEHVDLVPTVCGLLGLEPHPNFQGIDALSAARPPAEQRLTFCHVLSSLAEADSVILGGRWKLTEDRRGGFVTLYDLQNDPGETNNLVTQDPVRANQLQAALRTWREQQLAYYHYPPYYLNFYPPAPPRIE